MSECSCGLEQPFEACCEPIINGQREAATPEALMRSRYSAYVHGKVEYLINSVHPETRKDHDLESIRSWAEGSQWHGLEIVATRNGGAEDETGEVEFIAHYSEKKTRHRHHELAEFRKEEGKWYFYDGSRVKPQQVVRETPKVGRNEACPCGSGKKYKKCCARQ